MKSLVVMGVVVIALLGALLSYGLAALRSRLLPWVPDVGDR